MLGTRRTKQKKILLSQSIQEKLIQTLIKDGAVGEPMEKWNLAVGEREIGLSSESSKDQ
jgi:hypothetical protein